MESNEEYQPEDNSLLAQDRALLESLDLDEPEHKNFKNWGHAQRLDYIGGRILAKARTTKSHRVMKEEGYLSYSQMERRKDRETYASPDGDIEDLFRERGVFSRMYIDRGKGQNNDRSSGN